MKWEKKTNMESALYGRSTSNKKHVTVAPILSKKSESWSKITKSKGLHIISIIIIK